MFDLDTELAPAQTRLAQLTNKCDVKNLDYYIQECGRILCVEDENKRENGQIMNASAILHTIATQLARFKMSDYGI